MYTIKYFPSEWFNKYHIQLLDFENYTIKDNKPKIYEIDNHSNKMICQCDLKNKILKFAYPAYNNDGLKYIEINNNLVRITETYIDEDNRKSYGSITLIFSDEIDFICFLKDSKINCFHKNKSDNSFTKISDNFVDNCVELKTFFFVEKNEFVLLCKKSHVYHLFIFDPNHFDTNIQRKNFSIPDYNGKVSIIYDNKINDYNIIYDNNFTQSCAEFNQEQDTVNKENEDDIFEIEFETQKNDVENTNRREKIVEIITINSNQTKEQIIENIEEIISDKEIGKDYEIKGEDYNIIIKPTNSSSFENSTKVDFEECEKALREKYDIPDSSIITFFQIEIKNNDENSLYYQIKYFTYDDNKNILDLSICSEIETQIHYAIKDDANLDVSTIEKFKEQGIDIFNIKDEFFSDICNSYSESDNDMILEDRINYIFQNYSLCEEGCSYDNIDMELMSVTCNCKIDGNFSSVVTPLMNNYDYEISFLDSNIGIVKCYRQVFTLKNKSNNIGFILFTILILIYILFLVIFLCKGIKPISDFVFNEMKKYGYIKSEKERNITSNTKSKTRKKSKKIKKCNKSNPTKKVRNKKNKNRIIGKNNNNRNIRLNLITTRQESNKDNVLKENKSSMMSNLGLRNLEKNKNDSTNVNVNKIEEDEDEIDNLGIIKINLNGNIKEYMPKDSYQTLRNYTFEEAVQYDHRNILRVFYIYLLSKQIIFHTFFYRSPFELFTLRFTLFIFMFLCDLALNSLFYLNDNISKKYHYAKNLFLFAFSNNLTIIIYSTLVSYFLIVVMTKLTNSTNAIRNIFRKEEEKIKLQKKYKITEDRKKEINQEILRVFKNYKIKIFFLFFIEIILILFFWYFVTAFCFVYSSTQTSWLIDCFLSILSRFFFEIIFAFLYAKLYRVAITSSVETLYKIVMCLYDLI